MKYIKSKYRANLSDESKISKIPTHKKYNHNQKKHPKLDHPIKQGNTERKKKEITKNKE
jgi:hypothetical protein